MNVNMITCGGQATAPIVNAVSSVVPVPYAEIVASISSQVRRAGHPRQHRRVHRDHLAGRARGRAGAERGKAIIILNPVEPPLMMRNSVFCAIRRPTPLQDALPASIHAMVAEVQDYVPGYHLRADPQFDPPRDTWDGMAGFRCPSRSRAPATTCRTTPATSTSSPRPRPASATWSPARRRHVKSSAIDVEPCGAHEGRATGHDHRPGRPASTDTDPCATARTP